MNKGLGVRDLAVLVLNLVFIRRLEPRQDLEHLFLRSAARCTLHVVFCLASGIVASSMLHVE
jgi:hypothetical protein